MNKTTLFLTAGFLIFILEGCTNSNQELNRENILIQKIDSLEQELKSCNLKSKESLQDESIIDLKGQYVVFNSKNNKEKLIDHRTYFVELDNIKTPGWIDPNSYSVINYLNEGYECKLEGNRSEGVVVLSGKILQEQKG